MMLLQIVPTAPLAARVKQGERGAKADQGMGQVGEGGAAAGLAQAVLQELATNAASQDTLVQLVVKLSI